MTESDKAKSATISAFGTMSDCCGSAIIPNKDGADTCADCLECCDAVKIKVDRLSPVRLKQSAINALCPDEEKVWVDKKELAGEHRMECERNGDK